MRRSPAFLACIWSAALALPAAPVLSKPTGDQNDQALEAFRFDQLEARLATWPAGPEHDYFAGMTANAEGRIDESIELLTAALPALRKRHRARAVKALETLADDYTKKFQYADAKASDDDLLTHFMGQLTRAEIKGVKDDAQLSLILSEAPRQTIAMNGTVDVKTARNALGSLDTDLTVNGVTAPWLLDTGANMSVITDGFAKRLGLVPLAGVTRTQAGMTGIENSIHVAIIPTLQIGGATLRNVVALVLPDDNLNVQYDRDGRRHQINAIVGYPVFQALERVTFRADGRFLAGDAASESAGGARMYMKGLIPVVACGVEGQTLPFSFDTGASGTDLLVAYYRRFKAQASRWKSVDSMSAGAGGVVKRKVFIQDTLTLQVGNQLDTLHHLSINDMSTGADNADLYGNLGQDLVAGFDSFTLDFENMRFSLGQPLVPAPEKP